MSKKQPGVVVVGDGSGEPPALPHSFGRRMAELLDDDACDACNGTGAAAGVLGQLTPSCPECKGSARREGLEG